MGDIPGHVRACLHSGKLAFLAIMVSGGIVLQILVSVLFIRLTVGRWYITYCLKFTPTTN